MTDHLPECCVGTDDCNANPCQRCHACCICDEPRACAKRVLDGASEQDYANGKSHGLLDGYEDGYQEGYADALDAAREAVEYRKTPRDLNCCYVGNAVLDGALRKAVLSTYTEIADILENLPLLVRLHRRSRGLSLRQASAQSGVDFSTLTRLEHCENTGLVSVVLVLRWMEFSR